MMIRNSKSFVWLTICLLMLLSPEMAVAQTDSLASDQGSVPLTEKELKRIRKAERKAEKEKRNFRFNIIGGPGYTPDFGFVIGGSLLTTFRTNPSDTSLLRSVLPLTFGATFGQGVGVNSTLYPQLFFKHDKFRITGRFIIKNTGDNYYGIGYSQNSKVERGPETTEYFMRMIQINPTFLFRIKESNYFVGPTIDYVQDHISKPAAGVVNDPYYIRQGGDSAGIKLRSSSIGVSLSYDSRDVPSNPYKGWYLDTKLAYAPKFLGSTYNWGFASIDYRQYKSVGLRKVIAWTFNSKNAIGDVPFTRMPMVGSPFDLRGLYLGQYRDKSAHTAMFEYRQMINTDGETFIKKMVNRLGFATWAGCGFLGPNPVRIEGVLPNIGAGIRIELQPRMNLRFDVGYSPIDKQALLYMNITEAF
ncbi:MAG: BamA/TamA family outer membrane protein [Bacteroidales bacterium]